MRESYWELTPESRRMIEESILKKFAPAQRKRLEEMAKEIQSELSLGKELGAPPYPEITIVRINVS